MSKKIKKQEEDKQDQPPVFGNPEYSAKDDIYSREKKESLTDQDEDLNKPGKNAKHILTGDDLDIPGSELDDADEEIGEEDEENNYYSLGGDNHEDLEEDRGD